jgi:hypothetical protein
MEEVKQADFTRDAEESSKDLFGCSRNHSKEIDIYNKPYKEKIDRIN